MKRQIKSTISLVYSYGSVPERIEPAHGEAEALKQLRTARRFWNAVARCYSIHRNEAISILKANDKEAAKPLAAPITHTPDYYPDDVKSRFKGEKQ